MSDYLPDSLITHILCKLPVESLLRFRSVSKQWCSLISSPGFISTHLFHSRSSSTPSLLFLRHLSTVPTKQEHYSVYLNSLETGNFTRVKELNCPFKTRSGNHFRIVGLCNGLFCLSDDLYGYSYTIILWNPTIRKGFSLPKPSVHYGPYGPYMFSLGFGVDQKTQDLKVVRIAYLQGHYDLYTVPPIVEVYSLSTASWKTIDSHNIDCKLIEYFYSSVYLNGCIHWVCCRKNEDDVFSNSLLVLDLGDEKFSEMLLPQVLVHALPLDLSVYLCGDMISMIWYENGRDRPESCDRCVVWVMNKYGDVESWTEKFVVVLEGGGISHAVGFTGSGEFLVEKYVGDLWAYDFESKEFKDLGIHGAKDSFYLNRYIESLVLLDGSNGATTNPRVLSEATGGEKASSAVRIIEGMLLHGIGQDTLAPFVASGSGDATGVQSRLGSARVEKEISREWYLKTVYAKSSIFT